MGFKGVALQKRLLPIKDMGGLFGYEEVFREREFASITYKIVEPVKMYGYLKGFFETVEDGYLPKVSFEKASELYVLFDRAIILEVRLGMLITLHKYYDEVTKQ